MVEHWYPYIGHPEGTSCDAWFQVTDGMAYSTRGNATGTSTTPSLQILDGWAYPTSSSPDNMPTLEIIGSFVYASKGDPWFRIDRTPG